MLNAKKIVAIITSFLFAISIVSLIGCVDSKTRIYTVDGTLEFIKDDYTINLESIVYDENNNLVYNFILFPIDDDSINMNIKIESFIIDINGVKYGVGAPYEHCNHDPNDGDFFDSIVEDNLVNLSTHDFSVGRDNRFSILVDIKTIIGLYLEEDIPSNEIENASNCIGLNVDGYYIIFGDYNLH